MDIKFFDFELPAHLIAQHPIHPKEAAKLLIVDQLQNIQDNKISGIPDLVRENDVLVFNNTKVIPAKINAYIINQIGIETPVNINLNKSYSNNIWGVFVRPAKKLKIGQKVFFDHERELYALVIGHNEIAGVTKEIILEFNIPDLKAFWVFLDKVGQMPLPHYIERSINNNNKQQDDTDYQTMFAKNPGAVAAPTAGLHFTSEIIKYIKEKKAEIAFVTLHIGGGTFLPVRTKNVEEHHMHSEYFQIDQQNCDVINAAKAKDGRVIAIGTTSLRVLESVTVEPGKPLAPMNGETSIFITPGYKFKIVDILMTNFHLPCSTLFMLVSAFKGIDIMHKVYQHAIKNNYRFFSYGDACWLSRSQ